MTEWQLQKAKSRFSELIKQVVSSGPQVVTVRGKAEAVVLSKADYDRLIRGNQDQSLVTFLRQSPLAEHSQDIDLSRDDDIGRPVDL